MRRGKGGTNSKTQPKSQIQGFSHACHKPLDLTGKEVPLHHREYILLCRQHKAPCRDSVSCPDVQQERRTSTEQKLRERAPVRTGDRRPTACSHSCTSGFLPQSWTAPGHFPGVLSVPTGSRPQHPHAHFPPVTELSTFSRRPGRQY